MHRVTVSEQVEQITFDAAQLEDKLFLSAVYYPAADHSPEFVALHIGPLAVYMRPEQVELLYIEVEKAVISRERSAGESAATIQIDSPDYERDPHAVG